MRKLFCDRCGEEMKFAQMNVWIGSRTSDGLELCEKCCDALYRFMGISTPGGGYEKLDSEIAEHIVAPLGTVKSVTIIKDDGTRQRIPLDKVIIERLEDTIGL